MPRPRDIGQVLSECVKPLATEIRNTGRAHAWTAVAGLSPLDLAAERNAALRPSGASHHNPFHVLNDALSTRLFALADFLDGLSLVAVHGGAAARPVAYSSFPIVRAAMEALAYLYWTAEPDTADDERLVRFCIDLTHQLKGRHRLDRYAEADDVPLEHDWDDLAAMFKQWGVAHTQDEPHGQIVVRDEDGRGRKRPAALEIMAPVMPSADHLHVGAFFLYAVNDVTHAGLDAILRQADLTVDAETGARAFIFSRTRVLHRTAGVFWACYRPLKSVYSLLGWDWTELDTVYESRVQRLADAIAAEFGVESEPVQPIGEWGDHLADRRLGG